jgi:hypothetical protein
MGRYGQNPHSFDRPWWPTPFLPTIIGYWLKTLSADQPPRGRRRFVLRITRSELWVITTLTAGADTLLCH